LARVFFFFPFSLSWGVGITVRMDGFSGLGCRLSNVFFFFFFFFLGGVGVDEWMDKLGL